MINPHLRGGAVQPGVSRCEHAKVFVVAAADDARQRDAGAQDRIQHLQPEKARKFTDGFQRFRIVPQACPGLSAVAATDDAFQRDAGAQDCVLRPETECVLRPESGCVLRPENGCESSQTDLQILRMTAPPACQGLCGAAANGARQRDAGAQHCRAGAKGKRKGKEKEKERKRKGKEKKGKGKERKDKERKRKGKRSTLNAFRINHRTIAMKLRTLR